VVWDVDSYWETLGKVHWSTQTVGDDHRDRRAAIAAVTLDTTAFDPAFALAATTHALATAAAVIAAAVPATTCLLDR
jgi:hypothetical protein